MTTKVTETILTRPAYGTTIEEMFRVMLVHSLTLMFIACPFRCGAVGSFDCADCHVVTVAAESCCGAHAAKSIEVTGQVVAACIGELTHLPGPIETRQRCECGDCICSGALVTSDRPESREAPGKWSALNELEWGASSRNETALFAVSVCLDSEPPVFRPVGRAARTAFQSWLI